MYRIKQLPKDFAVREVMDLAPGKHGSYSYYLLRKRMLGTADAVRTVCRLLNVREKFVNYAGAKDRVAVTSQHISISRGPAKDLCARNLSITFLGRGEDRIALGSHRGNRFRIVVRNIRSLPVPKKEILNLFGSQRFGAAGLNHLAGKAIVLRDFKKAARLISYPAADRHLQRHPNDYVGALRTLPKRILLLYVHAYQSYLWNRLACHTSEKEVPVPGFASKPTKGLMRLLKEEGVGLRDFVVREMPDLSAEGTVRSCTAAVHSLQISDLMPDELNSGMKKCILQFFLEKGVYATAAVAQMFK